MSEHPYGGPERKTCMPCRKRKVKCDGRSPKCGPCSGAKRELDCVFPLRPENRDKRNALPKGKACRSCRSKKKKCDGLHPICSTCSRSRDGQPCIYDENNGASRGDSEGDADEDSPIQIGYASDGPSGPGQREYTPMSPREILIPSPSDSDDPISISIPSSPSPSPLSLSRADERQMGYFRSLAFSHALRLGMCFTPLKKRVILDGDMSGRYVHRWFAWFMAVMGVHLHQERRHQWGELRIQGTLTQILLRMVLGMVETELPYTILHAFYLMAMACTYTHTLVPARRYLERCQEIIKLYQLTMGDSTWIDASSRRSPPVVINDRPPEYTDEKHEEVSILVNLMYLQCIHCIMYNECHGLYADLEAQLPDFERAYPEVFERSSMVLRARTVLLVRDVFLHIGLLQQPDISQKEWLQDTAYLMSRLADTLQVLDNAVKRLNDNTANNFDDNEDPTPLDPTLVASHEKRQAYLLLSSCKLFCMTAQAQIYMETSNLPIVPKEQKSTFRDIARDSMKAFLAIYKTFDQEDDLRHLDYFTTMCWHKIRELYLILSPGDLSWFPFAEVSRQVILLESTLRVTPAGKNMSVMHSMANMENCAQSPDEPNFLKEVDRIRAGL